MGHILRMQPVLHEKIWGGSALHDIYGYEIPSDHTGEAWVISAHPNGDCKIAEGEFKGQYLSEVYASHRELFGHIDAPKFPLMVKILDANKDLSVQVHPDDDYAAKHENSLGKTECWYVLGAKEHTKMVMGHHAKTKEELKEMIEKDDYKDLLNVITINKGDFFYIPAGTLHAICAGSLIYEAQQSTDITYRVYDYHRKGDDGKERELHVKQSIDVTNCPGELDQETIFVNEKLDKGMRTHYLHAKYLSVYGYKIYGECIIPMDTPFSLVTCIDGEGTLNDLPCKKGDNFVVCSDVEEVVFDGGMDLMVTTL